MFWIPARPGPSRIVTAWSRSLWAPAEAELDPLHGRRGGRLEGWLDAGSQNPATCDAAGSVLNEVEEGAASPHTLVPEGSRQPPVQIRGGGRRSLWSQALAVL